MNLLEKKRKERIMKSVAHDIVDNVNDLLNDRSVELEGMTTGEMSTCLVNAISNVIAQHAHVEYKVAVGIVGQTVESIKDIVE